MYILSLILFILKCDNPINILFDSEYNLIEIQFLEYASDKFNKHLRFNLAHQLQYIFDAPVKIPYCYGFCITDNEQSTKSRIIYREAACNQRLKVLEDTNSKRRSYNKKQNVMDKRKGTNLEHVELSTPCYLYVNTSNIVGGGRGVFTKVSMVKGAIFGPYAGIQRSRSQMSKKDPSRAWTISGGVHDDFYIDGSNENKSNWLRYVNSARCHHLIEMWDAGHPAFRFQVFSTFSLQPMDTYHILTTKLTKIQLNIAKMDSNNKVNYFHNNFCTNFTVPPYRLVMQCNVDEEQNVYPLQLEENIYYYLFRNVNAGDELLTWYGENYGRSLGIKFEKNYYSKRSNSIGLAPRKTDTNFASLK